MSLYGGELSLGNLMREISVKLFYKPFEKSKLTPNQITMLNFGINGVLAVFFFSTGLPRIALIFCILSGMIDYIDGALARRKFGGNTDLGKWLDTSLDWLYYLMLIGGISYGVGQMVLGSVCIIATVFANYIDTQRPTIKLDGFPFSPVAFIIVGAVLNQMSVALYCMTFFAVLRAIILWKNSIKKGV